MDEYSSSIASRSESATTPIKTFPPGRSVAGAAAPDTRDPLIVSAVAVAVLATALLGRGLVPAVTSGYPDVAFLMRWVVLPAWVLAASVALCAPGVLLVGAFSPALSLNALVLRGFLASHALLVVTTSLVKVAGRIPFGTWDFAATMAGLTVACGAVYVHRYRRGLARGWTRADLTPGIAVAAVGPMLVAILQPEIFWQDLNADGFEAFEIGRALQWVVVPRFPNSSSFQGLGIGMVTMAWSNHWWMLLAGKVEAACRLPLAVHAAAAVAGLGTLAEFGQERRLRPLEWGGLVAGAIAVIMVLAFNASYDPYNVDLSSPAAFELMTLALLCGIIHSAWSRAWGWLALFVLFGVLARPTALLVGLFVAAAMFATDRESRGAALKVGAVVVAVFAVTYLVYERGAVALLGEREHPGYGTASLLHRVRYVTFTEPYRLLWVVLPAGVLPWLSMAGWKRHDVWGKTLVLVTLAYTGFFLPLSFTNLHQFVPAMVLPVSVYWRLAMARTSTPPWWVTGAAAGAALSLVLAWPTDRTTDRSVRAIASQLRFSVGSMAQDYGEYRKAIRAVAAMEAVVPPEWEIRDLGRERAGGGHVAFYAMGGPADPLAVVQDSALSPPPGHTFLRTARGATAWVRDTAALRTLRHGDWSLGWRRPPYNIPRETMFSFLGSEQAYDLDLFGAMRKVVRLVRPEGAGQPTS